MKRVKYYYLAKTIKIVAQLVFLLGTIGFLLNLYLDFFHPTPYFRIGRGTLGNHSRGYPIKASLSLNIPDTITFYKDAEIRSRIDDPIANGIDVSKDSVLTRIVNEFSSVAGSDVTLRTDLHANDVTVRAISKKIAYNVLWSITSRLDQLFGLLFLVVLIKLTNRYIDHDIFAPRTFKLVSFFGFMLIVSEILTFIGGLINMLIMQHPTLHTRTLVGAKVFQAFDLSVSFDNAASFNQIGVGIVVILLSQVLKEAVKNKEEIELTI